MQDSWTSLLINRRVEAVEQREACTCVIKFSGGYRIQIESLWRLRTTQAIVLTSEDDGQPFGHSEPVKAITSLSDKLLGQNLASVQVTHGTADLALHFGKHVLEIISNSSGYEAWQIEGPANTLAVGQGGGNVAVWD